MKIRPSDEAPAAPPAPAGTYWVMPGRFLAGCFPGALHRQEHDERLEQLLDAGMRVFINLMETDERNRAGVPFADYAPHVQRLSESRGEPVRCVRLPIRDLDVPSTAEMEVILDTLDGALREGAAYLHCLGGVGRTGTVVACWLLRHRWANGANVLKVLAESRTMDRQRGHRQSPETAVQLRFVRDWGNRRASPR